MSPVWSPDSKWIAYTKLLKNHLRAAVSVFDRDRASASGVRRHERRASSRTSTRTASISTSPPAPIWACRPRGWTCRATATRSRATYTWWCCARTSRRPWRRKATREKAEKRRRGQGQRQGGTSQRREAKDPAKFRSTSRTSASASLALPIPARDYIGMAGGQRGHTVPVGERSQSGPADGPPHAPFTSST